MFTTIVFVGRSRKRTALSDGIRCSNQGDYIISNNLPVCNCYQGYEGKECEKYAESYTRNTETNKCIKI